jgi:hypothetical protein
VFYFIFLLAIILRLWGVGFGLPGLYQPDEGKILYTVFYAASNGFRPDTFTHSTLIAYLLIPFYGAYYLIGRILGGYSSPFDFYVGFLADPTSLVLLGRVLMALVSLSSVAAIYVIGKKFFNRRVGILSAFFLSGCFLFVKESHYIKDEVLAALFLLIFFYFVLLAIDRRKTKDFYLAGVFLGLSVSAKYIYIPVALVLIVGLIWAKRNMRVVLATFLFALLSFFLTNPYMLIDYKTFIDQTKDIFLKARGIGTAAVGGRSAFVNFVAFQLPKGLGWPLYLFSLIGIFQGIVGLLGKKSVLVGLAGISLFLGILFGGGNFERWAVPLVPFFLLLCGIVIDGLSKRSVWISTLAAIVMIPSLLRTVKFNNIITWSDTRTLARQWIEENIQAGTSIAIEGTTSDEVTSYLGPQLVLDQEGLGERYKKVVGWGGEGLNLRAKIEAYSDRVGYDLTGVPRLNVRLDSEKEQFVEIDGVEYYKDRGVNYLVRSSWVRRVVSSEFYETLEDSYSLLKVFKPTVVFDMEPHAFAMDYQALDRVPFLGRGVFGPVIRIYHLKGD